MSDQIILPCLKCGIGHLKLRRYFVAGDGWWFELACPACGTGANDDSQEGVIDIWNSWSAEPRNIR